MATIQKRGQSYSIRVSSGYDISGKQIIHSKTWTPKPGLSERQIKKEWNGKLCYLKNRYVLVRL